MSACVNYFLLILITFCWKANTLDLLTLSRLTDPFIYRIFPTKTQSRGCFLVLLNVCLHHNVFLEYSTKQTDCLFTSMSPWISCSVWWEINILSVKSFYAEWVNPSVWTADRERKHEGSISDLFLFSSELPDSDLCSALERKDFTRL